MASVGEAGEVITEAREKSSHFESGAVQQMWGGDKRLSGEGREGIPGREKQEQRGGNYWHVREPAVLLTSVCGRGWLTGNAGWDQKLEPCKQELGLCSVASEKLLTRFRWTSSIFTEYVSSLGGWWVLRVYCTGWCLELARRNEVTEKQATDQSTATGQKRSRGGSKRRDEETPKHRTFQKTLFLKRWWKKQKRAQSII